jgi:methionyl-tRNA formyltransferase
MGTPEFAVPSLRVLMQSPDVQVKGVVTQPDRPAGRNRKISAPPIKLVAQEESIPILQPDSLWDNSEALAWMAALRPDLAVVVAFGQLLPAGIFDFPAHGTLNVHPSLLPKYRGAAPIIHTLLAGERLTGVSIMRVDSGLDSGPVVARTKVTVDEDETAGQLEARLAESGAALLFEILESYLSGELLPEPQQDSSAIYAPAIQKKDGFINWSETAIQVHNHIRAFNPRPGCYAHFRGEILKIWEVRLLTRKAISGIPVGRLVQMGGSPAVVCGDGRLVELVEVQPANRNRLSGRDFSNGFRLSVEDLFS